MTTDPHALARKWASLIGIGFHPDTRGDDYSPSLSIEEIKEYDADMDSPISGPFARVADRLTVFAPTVVRRHPKRNR
jgi:hypothetical protein